MSELERLIELVHVEVDDLNSLLGINGSVSYVEVMDVSKRIRIALDNLKLENRE